MKHVLNLCAGSEMKSLQLTFPDWSGSDRCCLCCVSFITVLLFCFVGLKSTPGESQAIIMTAPTIVFPQKAVIVQQEGRSFEQAR